MPCQRLFHVPRAAVLGSWRRLFVQCDEVPSISTNVACVRERFAPVKSRRLDRRDYDASVTLEIADFSLHMGATKGGTRRMAPRQNVLSSGRRVLQREDARRVIRIGGLFREQVRTEGTSNVIHWRDKTAQNVGSEHRHANLEKINLSCRLDVHDGAFSNGSCCAHTSPIKLDSTLQP